MSAKSPKTESVSATSFVRLNLAQQPGGGVRLSRRRRGAYAMSLVAIATLVQRRQGYDSLGFMAAEIAVCGLCILLAGYLYQRCRRPAQPQPWVSWSVRGLAAAALLFLWWLNAFAKGFDYGNGLEIVMLCTLAWGGLLCTTLATRARTISLSVVCHGFVTLFTTLTSDSATTTWFAYTWVALCVWWLVNNHWESLDTRVAEKLEYSSGLRWSLIAMAVGLFVGGSLVFSNRLPVLRRLSAEVMPTSGGNSWHDSAARSGVGNGDALVAAQQHATTFGAVETEMFLESEKPSLFDVFSDEFGEPKTKERVEKAQALSRQDATGDEGKSTEANRAASTNEFSTDRKSPRRQPPSEDLVADALLFWQGEPGAHLAVERFDHFDGSVWSRLSPSKAASELEPEAVEVEGSTWFFVPGDKFSSSLSPYRGTQNESIQFTRFRSPVIPSRNGCRLWRIDQINRADFFAYANDDCLSMPGRAHVPDYTLVRFVNGRLSLDTMESLLQNCAPGQWHFSSSEGCQAQIAKLSHLYALDLPRGWPQVAAVVAGLRREFQLTSELASINPAATLAEDGQAEDGQAQASSEPTPVERFLETGRGPSYLFATTAALMLEHLGYQTRLVTGFYVDPNRGIRGRQQYAVVPADAHVWLEINAGHGYWIPLEPSPGFEPPTYVASLWYRLLQARWQIASAVGWLSLLLIIAYVLRGWLFDGLCWLAGPVLMLISDRQLIAWLTWTLDRRLALCGRPRPRSAVPRQHFTQVLQLSEQANQRLKTYWAAADRLFFGDSQPLTVKQRQSLRTLWRELDIGELRKCFRQPPLRDI